MERSPVAPKSTITWLSGRGREPTGHATASATFAVRSSVCRRGIVLPEDGAAGDEQVRPGLADLGRVPGRNAPVHLHEYGVWHQGAQFLDAA